MIESTSSRIQRTGAVINVEQLLFLADAISKGTINVSDMPKYFANKEIEIVPAPHYAN